MRDVELVVGNVGCGAAVEENRKCIEVFALFKFAI
jgi:hypothetical protein